MESVDKMGSVVNMGSVANVESADNASVILVDQPPKNSTLDLTFAWKDIKVFSHHLRSTNEIQLKLVRTGDVKLGYLKIN